MNNSKYLLIFASFCILCFLIAIPSKRKYLTYSELSKFENAAFEMSGNSLDINLTNFPDIQKEKSKIGLYITTEKALLSVSDFIKIINEIKSYKLSSFDNETKLSDKEGFILSKKYFLGSDNNLYSIKSKNQLGKLLINLRPEGVNELLNQKPLKNSEIAARLLSDSIKIKLSESARHLLPNLSIALESKDKKSINRLNGAFTVILSNREDNASSESSSSQEKSNEGLTQATNSSLQAVSSDSSKTNILSSANNQAASSVQSNIIQASSTASLSAKIPTSSVSSGATSSVSNSLISLASSSAPAVILVSSQSSSFTSAPQCSDVTNCFEFANPGTNTAAGCATYCKNGGLTKLKNEYSPSDSGLSCAEDCSKSGEPVYLSSRLLPQSTTPMSYHCGYGPNSFTCVYPDPNDSEMYKSKTYSGKDLFSGFEFSDQQAKDYIHGFSLLPDIYGGIEETKNRVDLSGEKCKGTPPSPSAETIKKANDSCYDYVNENIPQKEKELGDLLCEAKHGKGAKLDKIDRVAIIECDKTENMCECCYKQKCKASSSYGNAY